MASTFPLTLGAITAVLAGGIVACSADGAPLTLAEAGKSKAVIVVGEGASAPIRKAADELQKHIRKAAGAVLAVMAPDSVPPDAICVCVGPSRTADALFGPVDTASLGHDGIVMRTTAGGLLLTGRPPRGTLYAVYTFLEEIVGCRWWTSTESRIPQHQRLVVPDLDTAYAPALRSREAFYRDAFNGPFAARLKLNGHFMRIPAELGGRLRLIGWCHTFNRLIPPATYFEKHPEWFSEINGERKHERTQLCLTNLAMRAELTKNALEWIRKEADAGIISISQNDWGGRCECAACREVEEQEGSPSGLLVHFVNAVAADIGKEFPDILVETLAYQYTRQAPRHVRPRRNVVIRLCSIECSYAQPLESGSLNEKFRADIEAWSAISPQLYIWNYVTNFANCLLPHPNMRALGQDIRLFVKHKTLGLFEQGDAYTTTGDFVRMRAWVLAHLMWDPSRDQGALTREFMEGYYGPAAPYLLAYLELVHEAVAKTDIRLRCYMQDTSSWLPFESVNAATGLFNQAAVAVADRPELAARVERERLVLDHVWLKRYHALRRQAKRRDVDFLGPADPAAACKAWVELNREHGNTHYGEGRAFEPYAAALQRRFAPPGPPPEQCKGLDEEKWIDLQDSRFRLHGVGRWVEYVDDPASSNGSAVRMPGSHHQWAAQCEMPEELEPGQFWRCFVVARCEANAQTGVGIQMGIYDRAAKKGVADRSISIEESAGQDYRVFDLGTHELTDSKYFWVAPCMSPDDVKAVYVDRIFVIRADRP
ncbi:MAG: DUF4838 domain-containing protein [Lentisphaerae bacterium]|nr:DUF4838 domain-containing protein [Lentisphaerota bacterium]MBT4818365.1 DUF4838 domain-containing protein [Lentisphaerota bacterium]MBT5610854.1 DUF4838 domain-containing protein [Lentisphaerota bacterium]MBT7053714.1 DUF4838 domain-containing protein [Lentisphaerota bacterium]MBT7841175.1 DUF4838 domain-containing protein [Lentisphaerota bacterium]